MSHKSQKAVTNIFVANIDIASQSNTVFTIISLNES